MPIEALSFMISIDRDMFSSVFGLVQQVPVLKTEQGRE
jgi:hypothetical protein